MSPLTCLSPTGPLVILKKDPYLQAEGRNITFLTQNCNVSLGIVPKVLGWAIWAALPPQQYAGDGNASQAPAPPASQSSSNTTQQWAGALQAAETTAAMITQRVWCHMEVVCTPALQTPGTCPDQCNGDSLSHCTGHLKFIPKFHGLNSPLLITCNLTV